MAGPFLVLPPGIWSEVFLPGALVSGLIEAHRTCHTNGLRVLSAVWRSDGSAPGFAGRWPVVTGLTSYLLGCIASQSIDAFFAPTVPAETDFSVQRARIRLFPVTVVADLCCSVLSVQSLIRGWHVAVAAATPWVTANGRRLETCRRPDSTCRGF
jgi:hypothetical protein